MNRRRRVFILGSVVAILIATTAVALAGHGTTNVLSFTGCLKTNNGTLSRFAVGDTPQSPCPSGNVEMHVSGGDITSVETVPGSGLQGGGTNGALSLNLATVPAARVFSTSPLDVDNEGDEPGRQFAAFDGESFDTAGLHDSTNPTRLTAPVDGIYVIVGNVEWCNSSEGFRQVTVMLGQNGFMAQSRIDAVAQDGLHTSQSVSAILGLASGDYVQLDLQQGSSGNLCTLGTTEGNPSLSMAWIGPDQAPG
jgi:hypothetical protein